MKKIILLGAVVFACSLLQQGFSQTWSAIGNGVPGRVSSMIIYNGELYVGGQFNLPGSSSPVGLMKWNGSAFDTVPGTYLFGSCRIEALAVYNNELYVGGGFCQGCSPIPSVFNFMAKWNGTSWDSVEHDFNNVVYALEVYNGNLYAGGDFRFPTDTSYHGHIAKWNGSQWSNLQGTDIDGDGGRVFDLIVYNNELYVAGAFVSVAGNSSLSCIGRWNDISWNEVGPGGINGAVFSLGVFNNELYAGGSYFDVAGGVPVNQFAKWDGTSWSAFGTGFSGATAGLLLALQEYHNEFYVGGLFSILNGDSLKSIARYNGINWNSVGGGIDSTIIIVDTMILGWNDTILIYAPHTVSAFMEYNNDLYVGGTFNMIGGVVAHNIAKWSTPVGISDIFFEESILLYPNPAAGQLSFSEQVPNDATIRIFNTLGQEVLEQMIESHKSIDVSSLPPGYYSLLITTINKRYAATFVKQ